MILKNAAVSLFQKTNKTPIMLAMPEVTVITWSGPAYSANKNLMTFTLLDFPADSNRCGQMSLSLY